MTRVVIFDPTLPWALIWGLVALAVLAVGVALWRRLKGWPLRLLALAAVLAAVANPVLQEENRAALRDVVVLLRDASASQGLSDRAAQTEAALAAVRAEVAALPDTDLVEAVVPDGEGDEGTRAMAALAEALAGQPRARIAGAILVTDGQVHDAGLAPALPAPLHVLLTGHAADWDRRLVITDAPAFAILGEEVRLSLRIEDQGAVPATAGAMVDLTITLDAEEPLTFTVPVGEDLDLPVSLPHAGANVLQFAVAEVPGELTDRNNAAVVTINGVRDRLRVLLVSGEPHAGERVWRNLLKSDPSVDLVHFTILRPPEKQDGVPVEELSLIAFPTRELFVEKIDEFDLIIFDRYRMRGILPTSYIENVVNYVRQGGTVLVASGPEFGAVDSLWRTPLAEILPARPTARVIEEGYSPALTDLGRRHPVTEALEDLAPEGGWGRWFRLVEVETIAGQVLMEGPGNRPLLVVNRVDEGRVAVLASDHAWLWGRGFEGGGPQLELLRRLAHWMLKEPELEEENLAVSVREAEVTVTRRTLKDTPPPPVTITGPDGARVDLPLAEQSPGKFAAVWAAPAVGLYRLDQDELTVVAAIGPRAPKEFEQTLATEAVLEPVVAAAGGGVLRIEDGLPDIRQVAPGRVAAGRGWIGITPRGAYVTEDIRLNPLMPAWAWLVLAAGFAVAAWLVEGRRRA